MRVSISPGRGLRGEIKVPSDKSISHRALMLGAIARGRTFIHGLSPSADVLATSRCLRQLGVEIETAGSGEVSITGRGDGGLLEPGNVLDAANSGTTARLLAGILAGQPLFAVLTGDSSLRRRPMDRIIGPLAQMGAAIAGREGDRRLPIGIRGGNLAPIEYHLPVASAQVKSCVLLAGLFAEGETVVVEPLPTRDHTERMMQAMGVTVSRVDGRVGVTGRSILTGLEMRMPGDFSAAAFFLAAATLAPDSEVVIRGVGVNPTRTGFLWMLKDMGADVLVENERLVCGEPVADLCCRASQLRGTTVQGEMVPGLIDELPILAVVATQAEGQTIVRDAQELRAKESDRIKTVVTELGRLGARIRETEDGFVVEGPTALKGARCRSYGDHRVAMSLAVAGLLASGDTTIDQAQCVDVSFPRFFDRIGTLCHNCVS